MLIEIIHTGRIVEIGKTFPFISPVTMLTVSNDAVRNQNQLRIAASDGSAEFLIPFIICRAEIFVSN